ncbi:MAG: phosphotransferase [Deltaproteobacteria bacterium]|nr:phosphotransferase [Deltaproteobacteria bacterium]
MDRIIRELLTSQTKIPQNPFQLQKLSGDASTREYYRLKFDDGKSLIVMKIPAGLSSVSEEITKTSKKINELPFINVQKYLKSLGLPVPDTLAYSKNDGLLLLEDFGDVTLEKTVRDLPSAQRTGWYEKALDLLALLQKNSRAAPPKDCIAAYRTFDADLLNWEFDHFLEYGIEDRLQIKVPATDKKKFAELTRDITQKIVQMPQGFTHRDFQSRNLMVQNDSLRLIDFQDALTGPLLYDLVALLRDSYVELSPAEIAGLQEYYAKKIDAGHSYHAKIKAIRNDFDLITIQRKLKDAGRFQYIKTVKKNDSFLKSVPASLRYVQKALGRQKDYAELTRLIAKYLPELREKT